MGTHNAETMTSFYILGQCVKKLSSTVQFFSLGLSNHSPLLRQDPLRPLSSPSLRHSYSPAHSSRRRGALHPLAQWHPRTTRASTWEPGCRCQGEGGESGRRQWACSGAEEAASGAGHWFPVVVASAPWAGRGLGRTGSGRRRVGPRYKRRHQLLKRKRFLPSLPPPPLSNK